MATFSGDKFSANLAEVLLSGEEFTWEEILRCAGGELTKNQLISVVKWRKKFAADFASGDKHLLAIQANHIPPRERTSTGEAIALTANQREDSGLYASCLEMVEEMAKTNLGSTVGNGRGRKGAVADTGASREAIAAAMAKLKAMKN